MKKILVFLNGSGFSGGANRSFLDLLPILSSEYDVSIVGPHADSNYKNKVESIISGKYYERRRFYGYSYIKDLYKAKNIIKRIFYPLIISREIKAIDHFFNIKFDLIYSNSLAIQVGCEYAKKHKTPHLWHVREFMNEDHGFEFLLKKHTYKKLFSYSNAIFISEAIENKFSAYFKKNIVLHNYVDFKPIEKKQHDKFTFIMVGAITESKGQRYAIECFYKVQKVYDSIKLIIVGTGSDESYCKEIVKNYGLDNEVEFLGQRKDVSELLAVSDVLLMCSRFEALGRVTVEGMLSKTLVIGADTAATKELIQNNRGLLYRQGDNNDLFDKMLFTIENYDKMKGYIDNAYEYAREEFSYGHFKEKFLSYLSVIK